MIDGRTPLSLRWSALVLSLVAVVASVLVAVPSYADRDIPTVRAQVHRLYAQAEQASERFNAAREEMRTAQVRLRASREDLARQQREVSVLRGQVAASVVSQYQGQALSSATQVLLSSNPDAFLSQLSTVSAFQDQQAQLVTDFAVQAKQLGLRRQAAQREVVRVQEIKQQLGAEKATINRKAASAKQLLGRLQVRAAARRQAARQAATEAARQAAQQAASRRPAVSRSANRTAAPPAAATSAPVSGSAAAAVAFAQAQVGKAYVYGASGPSAYDCSGLTMAAWAQAGVSLPHSASGQMSSGTPVSQSQLHPGDLVFYYSPVHHVGMYIGNGQIVHAANPSTGVSIAPVNSMPYSGAVRPG